MAKKNRNATPSHIAIDLAIAFSARKSARTISLRLNQVCLYAWKPLRCTLFQPRYCRERLSRCKEHIDWGKQQWSREMFSDEPPFTETSVSGHQLLWREKGTCYAQQCDHERDHYDQDMPVWVFIMHSEKHC